MTFYYITLLKAISSLNIHKVMFRVNLSVYIYRKFEGYNLLICIGVS